ncbi:phosphopantetheine-binding protein [Sorangium sp. So ce1151]|uniref:phosphopantetheine-binding protein n=1 Tax=Sorangium sp. So ce1151 TaxID=3133332 RepID=UPI003F621575
MQNAFLFTFNEEINESTDLFKAGIVDSFGYVQLITFLQKNFQITFSNNELLSNVLTSLSAIVATVEAKLDEAQRAKCAE